MNPDTFEDRVTAVTEKIVAAQLGRRQTARARVLALLRRGPATTSELLRVCARFGARIHELRSDGATIIQRKLPGEQGSYVYSLLD